MSIVTRSMVSNRNMKIDKGLTTHSSDTSISCSEYSSDTESENSETLSLYDSDSTDTNTIHEEDYEEYSDIDNLKLIIRDKNTQVLTNKEIDYIHEQEVLINQINNQNHSLRFKVLKCPIDINEKARIIKLLDRYENMETSSEYGKIAHYIEHILDIPFDVFKKINIVEDNTPSNISIFLKNMKSKLDDVIYGHDYAKLEIMQILSQMISNPNSNGNIIGIHGPPGIGKTTLVKEGIAKILDRPFSFISLGGCSDACFLEGHSFTYEGSQPGAIVEILKKSKCMNPIIYFDELDKVSETTKGDEIINQLIHITDESQNNKIADKYLGNGIELDLSKAILIFSFNDLTKINPILKDRINMIELKDFTEKEKINIADKYLLKTIYRDYNIDEKNIIIKDEIYGHLFSKYLSGETGVRKLKQLLKSLISKLNMILLVDSNKDILTLLNIETIKIPIILDIKLVDILLTNNKSDIETHVLHSLYS